VIVSLGGGIKGKDMEEVHRAVSSTRDGRDGAQREHLTSSGTRTVIRWKAPWRKEGRKKPEAFLSSDIGESQGSKPERLRKTCSDPQGAGTEIHYAGRYQRPGDLPRHSKDRTTSFRLPARIAIYQRTCGTLRTGEHQHPHSLRERLGS
jgi:hypothetical protein